MSKDLIQRQIEAGSAMQDARSLRTRGQQGSSHSARKTLIQFGIFAGVIIAALAIFLVVLNSAN